MFEFETTTYLTLSSDIELHQSGNPMTFNHEFRKHDQLVVSTPLKNMLVNLGIFSPSIRGEHFFFWVAANPDEVGFTLFKKKIANDTTNPSIVPLPSASQFRAFPKLRASRNKAAYISSKHFKANIKYGFPWN